MYPISYLFRLFPSRLFFSRLALIFVLFICFAYFFQDFMHSFSPLTCYYVFFCCLLLCVLVLLVCVMVRGGVLLLCAFCLLFFSYEIIPNNFMMDDK